MFSKKTQKILFQIYRKGNRAYRYLRLIWHGYVKGRFQPHAHAFINLPSDIWPGTVKRGQSIITGYFT